MRKIVQCFLLVFVFCTFCMVSASDKNGDVYKLVRIMGLDINSLGYDQDLMVITLYPDGTLSFIFDGEEENATFWKLDGNNITIVVDGSEITGTLINDMLTLIVDNDELTLKKELATISVGDLINFGKYEQDGNLNNGPEPVVWQILTVQNGQALVISQYILDNMSFNTSNKDVEWDDCSLRTWLNGYFYENVFSITEQKQVLLTTFGENNKSPDHIFLLSKDEISSYFGEINYQAAPTAYAVWNGANNDTGSTFTQWWLRSTESGAADCMAEGSSIRSQSVSSESGVRPAFWLNMEESREE